MLGGEHELVYRQGQDARSVDYSLTLGQMAKTLRDLQRRLATIEDKPALGMTPDVYRDRIEEMGPFAGQAAGRALSAGSFQSEELIFATYHNVGYGYSTSPMRMSRGRSRVLFHRRPSASWIPTRRRAGDAIDGRVRGGGWDGVRHRHEWRVVCACL